MLQLFSSLRRSCQLQQALTAVCSYSTEAATAITSPTTRAANPSDYGLVLKQAAELGKGATNAPDTEVGLVSGVPSVTYNRQARIYCPTKNASQSGLGKTSHNSFSAPAWKLVFDSTEKWINPLIGWTSTADPLENVGRATLFFYNKEQAIAFCKKHGWVYTVDEPNMRRGDRQKRFAGYGDNFSVKRKGLPDLSHLPSNRQGSGSSTTSSSAGSQTPPAPQPAK